MSHSVHSHTRMYVVHSFTRYAVYCKSISQAGMSEDKHMCSTHESALHFSRDIVWLRHFQELGNHAPASFTWEELAQISNELRVCIEGSAPSENTLTMYVHQNVRIYQQYIHEQNTQMETCQQLLHEHTL